MQYIFPYPFIIFIIIAKGIFTHDEEKIVAFCLIIFGIILNYSVKNVLIEVFEERSAAIAAEYREALSIRREILPIMRRFWRIFQDLEDAVAHTCWLLFKKFLIVLRVKNYNRSFFLQHQVKHLINSLLSRKIKNINLVEKTAIKKALLNFRGKLLSNRQSISQTKNLLNLTNVNNNLHYLLVNKTTK